MQSLNEEACKLFRQKFSCSKQEGVGWGGAMEVVWASTLASTREPVHCLSEAGAMTTMQTPVEQ